MANKYKGSSIKRKSMIEMYGVSDLLKNIEKVGGNVDDAVAKAVDKSLEVVGKDMQSFMEKHKHTGDTMSSYEQVKAEVKNDKANAIVGYNIDNGGLPSIFLDVGTPKQKPYFFRYYAVQNSSGELQKIQKETLNEIFEGLKQ